MCAGKCTGPARRCGQGNWQGWAGLGGARSVLFDVDSRAVTPLNPLPAPTTRRHPLPARSRTFSFEFGAASARCASSGWRKTELAAPRTPPAPPSHPHLPPIRWSFEKVSGRLLAAQPGTARQRAYEAQKETGFEARFVSFLLLGLGRSGCGAAAAAALKLGVFPEINTK